ncbi:MAG: efflux RND transporter permease subunit [Chitinophagaceae bacterium]
MWFKLGKTILQYRLSILILVIIANIIAGYYASKVKLGYDFTRAIPTDNEKYIDYQRFKSLFGDDGSTMVIGFEAKNMFTPGFFNQAAQLADSLKKVADVENVLSVCDAINLKNDTLQQKFTTERIFQKSYTNAQSLDSAKNLLLNLPFYRGLLYNPSTNSYLIAVSLNKDTVSSKSRTRLINSVLFPAENFAKNTHTTIHVSGLPYLRTVIGNRIKNEMNLFLIASFALSAITLFLFFRSISATLMSLVVVGMGVIWCMATMVWFGYNITLLTALIPVLVVVIGIPNCIYFLNKYHTAYKEFGNKQKALITMVGRMGIVTLFCNIAAAIGFAVFALTNSALLKEFGLVAGINIMLLFVLSLLFIPIVLSYLPEPKAKEVRYLDNKVLAKILVKIDKWVFNNAKMVYGITGIISVWAIAGLFQLKSEGFIVDDLPKNDKIYTDLKWFEQQFGGVMPLEILVDTQKKKGLTRSNKAIEIVTKLDSLAQYIEARPETAKPLSYVEALKFVKQAFYDGDSSNYALPSESDLLFLSTYLQAKPDSARKTKANNAAANLLNRFVDSNKQIARISVNMKDVGSSELPKLLQNFEQKANTIFDTANYKVTFTGTSVTFLEGSAFIIKGLRDSIFWAFVLISACMLYLFKNIRILLCSLIPNIIPLIITAGLMGWTGVPLKPSTVLVFSVALGIAIDVTIRFLINYKQELPHYNHQVKHTLVQTIQHTGISIIYTSLVLVAGFIIFCFSSFGGTFSLGWLTSLTLVVGTLTNLVLLPILLLDLQGKIKKRKKHS